MGSDVIQLVQENWLSDYFHASTLPLLLYDILITFDEEVILIWNTRWSPSKIIFLCTRYLPVVGASSDVLLLLYTHIAASTRTCISYTAVSTAATVLSGVTICLSELILILRTYALFRNSKWILALLIGFYLSMILSSIAADGIFFRSIKYSDLNDAWRPEVPGCLLSGASKIVFVDVVSILVFETIIGIMTIYSYRQSSSHHWDTASTLVRVLYRDGILYFAYMFAFSLLNVLVIYLTPEIQSTLLIGLQTVLHSILSTRILLHIRKADAHDHAFSSAGHEIQTEMQFNDGPVARESSVVSGEE